MLDWSNHNQEQESVYPKLGFCSLGLMLRSLRVYFELLGSFVRQHQEGLSIAHLEYFEKYGAH